MDMDVSTTLDAGVRSQSMLNEPSLLTTMSSLQFIPQDVLRKYIMYAREKIRPKLFDLHREKIARLFSALRRESLATGSFPITVRHLESIIRMSEASAKMTLRETLTSLVESW